MNIKSVISSSIIANIAFISIEQHIISVVFESYDSTQVQRIIEILHKCIINTTKYVRKLSWKKKIHSIKHC